MASKVYHFNGGWLRPAIAREGHRQKAIRRALIGYDRPMTTRELAEAAWPRRDMRPGQQPPWRWLEVRRKIERYATRASPRTCPLTWIARPELLERGKPDRDR